MTLLQIVDNLERIALSQPNVRTAGEGNIYDKMNTNPSVKYGVFFITQNTHIEYEESDRYGLTLFYVDRLEDDMESNRLRIQSHGKQVLGNIITMFCNEFDIDFPEITYTPFTEKFVDMTAGVYANIIIDIYKDTLCEDGKSPVWEKVGVLQNKQVNLTKNGTIMITADNGYDGLKSVEINANVVDEDCYERGLAYGFESGITYQKSLLSSTALTENGTYTSENGFSAVTVNVHPDTTDLTVTVNGQYTPPSNFIGYSAVTVNVNSGDCLSNEFLIELASDYLETVTGVQVTLIYADQKDIYTYNGEPLIVAIYPGADYEIIFGNLNHHITPSSISGISRWNTSTQILAEYKWQSACYVDPESVEFEVTGGSAEISIVADGAWTATSTGDWYVQSTTTGTGNGTISIAAIGNNTGNILQGYVNIEFYDGTTGQTFVSQKPIVYLEVDEQYILFEHSGSSYHLAVSSNTDYSITVPDWITYTYEDNLLKLTASDLGDSQGRHGYVVFTYDGYTKAIIVSQVNPDYAMFVTSGGVTTFEYLENGRLDRETEFNNINGEVYVGSNCRTVAAMCGQGTVILKVLWFDVPSTSLSIGECGLYGSNIELLVIPKNVSFLHTGILSNSNINEFRLNSNIPNGTVKTSHRTAYNRTYAYFRCQPYLNIGSVGIFKIGPDVTSIGKAAFSKEDGTYRAYVYPNRIELYGKPSISINNYREYGAHFAYNIDGDAVDTFVSNYESEIHVPSTYSFYNVKYCVPNQVVDVTVPSYIREKFV